MAHEKTIHPREWDERQKPMAWMGFAAASVASGKPAAEAAKVADAMCSQFAQRFVGIDEDTPEA